MLKMRRPTFRDIIEANGMLHGVVRQTPLEFSFPLSERTGSEIWIKWENLQICGSFKIRGALNKMLRLSDQERARGVVTCSSGNHAQGVAMASKMLGVKSVVFVQNHCSEYKKRAIRNLGGKWAELVLYGKIFEETEAAAKAYCEDKGMVYVSSYHDHLVMAGAGTIGLEILMEQPDIEAVVVPTGSGGLINGIAAAVKVISPDVEVWGVQSRASMPWVTSWDSGTVVDFDYQETLADGLSGYILQDMLDYAKTHVSGFVGVSEDEMISALRSVFDWHHMVIEPSSAVAPAAVIGKAIPSIRSDKICVVISGGNPDTDLYKRLITEKRMR